MSNRLVIFFYIFIMTIHFSLFSEPLYSKTTLDSAQTSNVLVVITAFYNPTRFQYLAEVLSNLFTLPKTRIILLTN